MKDEQLNAVRDRIDTLDGEIVTLLNKRAALAQQVGVLKGKGPVVVPAREQAVLEHVIKENHGPLTDSELVTIFRELITACRNVQLR